MSIRSHSCHWVFGLLLFVPSAVAAMDLPHYDLDSLVYLSTDIVIANVSKDAHGNFATTVTEVLFGSIKPGDKLDALTPFLTFFQPMNDGQKIILFLDGRPRQYDFFHQDAAKSSYAVVPSGVYLIDEYGHVHQYFQQNNPGPYVAQGYTLFIEHTVPTEKDDLALPSLLEVKSQIAATVKSVRPVRNFLDQPTTAADVPSLINLLVARPRYPETCMVGTGIGMDDAIASQIYEKIQSLNDPDLLLRTWHLRGGDGGFLRSPTNDDRDKSFIPNRVNYLTRTLADHRKDTALRIAALQILSYFSGFHSGPRSGHSRLLPIDSNWLAPSADQILATTKAIFKNSAEDPTLRSLSLQFLDLNNRHNVADIQQVYRHNHSSELQFAIESAFLEVSDTLYQSLRAPSGPVASIIQLAPEHGCVQPPDNQMVFLARYYSTRAFNSRGFAVSAGQIVLKNKKSRLPVELNHVRTVGGYSGMLNGVLAFELDQLEDFPAGVYTLGMEYAHQFNHLPNAGEVQDVPSVGYTITIVLVDSPRGKRLSIPPTDKKHT